MNSKKIRVFWQKHPCGQTLVAEDNNQIDDFKKFFLDYDKFRYSTESHILTNLDKIDFKNKLVLEIGIGQASDAQQIIERGGKYQGIDFTQEACDRAVLRFKIFNKRYNCVVCQNICSSNLPNDYFDIIYSHGVLHHIPEIKAGAKEIYRISKIGGKIVIMLYAKRSLNYYLSIMFLRRLLILGLLLVDKLTRKKLIKNAVLRGHLNNIYSVGIKKYLSRDYFLSKNTDGPQNPYSRVYTEKEVRETFKGFSFYKFEQHFLNDRQLPLFKFLPNFLKNKLASRFGWHLWCYGEKI